MDTSPKMPKRSIELPLGCKDLIDDPAISASEARERRRGPVRDQLAYMEGYLARLIDSASGSYGLWLSRFQDRGMAGVIRDQHFGDRALVAAWRSVVQQRMLAAYFQDVPAVPISPPIGRWKTRKCIIYRLPSEPLAAARFAGEVFRGGYGLCDTSVISLDYHDTPAA